MSTPPLTAPGCLILVIDESAAMAGRPAGAPQAHSAPPAAGEPFANQAATAVNALLNQLAAGVDFPVALFGYSAAEGGPASVGSRWGGALAGRTFVPVREVVASPLRVESRTRRIPSANPLQPPREEPVDFPVWYEPARGAQAPQIAAFEFCRTLLNDATAAASGQPLLIHICAGSSTDGNPHKVITALQGAGVLVFHAHLGTMPNVPPTLFPSNRAYLPVGAVRDTFDRTSPLTSPMVAALKGQKLIINAGARGMIYNGKLTELVRLLSLVKVHTLDSAPAPAPAPAAPAPLAQAPVAPVPVAPPPAVTRPQPETEMPALAFDFAEPAQAGVDSYGLLPDLAEMPGVASDPGRLLVLVVDRSVADPFSGDAKNAFARLQQRANELLSKFAAKPDADLQVALAAYGLDALGQPEVRSGFEGALSGQPLVPAGQLAGGALRSEEVDEQISDGVGGLISVRRSKCTFLDLEPAGACSPVPAFREAQTVLEIWGREHPAPARRPLVLHLTRAAQPEAEMREAAGMVASAALYHLVATEEPHKSALYPTEPDGLDHSTLRLLWDLSSPLQDVDAFAKNPAVKPGARGFVVNGKFDCLLPPKAQA